MMTMPNITGRPLTPATIFGQPEPVCYEASTLGFKPGSWPRFVQWKGQRWTATSRVMDEGELAGVYYVNPASARMLIVNDRATGRFKHQWDYVGVVEDGEVGRCDLPSCGKYRISSASGDKVMTQAQFQRAYPEAAKEI